MVSRTSRKKSKGKERKAKKEAGKADIMRVVARKLWLGWTTGEDKAGNKMIQCDHGLGLDLVSIDLDHPITSFLDELFTKNSLGEFDSIIFQTHPQVWNDERLKKKVINILTRMGTNLLLRNDLVRNVRENRDDIGTAWAMLIARSIVVLEHHTVNGRLEDAFRSREVATKRRDLDLDLPTFGSNRRDCLKFFSKRVSCSCLKEIHEKARDTLPKKGRCRGCNQVKDRVALSVCSRCMISQYCSRECQVAAWPQHKGYCDQFVSVQYMNSSKHK